MKSELVPAFGGMAFNNGSDLKHQDLGLYKVYSESNLKMYVNYYDDRGSNPYYFMSSGKFHWSGGYNKELDLENFDCANNDNKFIHITFSDSEIKLKSDHYARIPLFYSHQKGALYFASSLSMLLKLIGTKTTSFDNNGLLFYYNFGFNNFYNHLIDDVQLLSGGQEITYCLNRNSLHVAPYFNLFEINRYRPNTDSLQANVERVDKALMQGTEETLSNFQNIGMAMSGGVDSGYLAQKINQCGRDFKSYTIGFKDSYNEFERIEYLSKRLNFSTKKIIVDPKTIIENYLQISENSSLPIYFNNSILNFVYKEASSDNVDVIFDGDGADRMFLGSNSFLRLKKVLKFYKLAKKLGLKDLVPTLLSTVDNSTLNNLRFYFKRFNDGYPFYGLRQLSNFSNYDQDFEQRLNAIALPFEIPDEVRPHDWLYFSMFSLYYFSPCFLHNQYELQLKLDMVSNPQFWTDEIVNIALTVPLNQKLRGGTTKLVLREAAKSKIDDGYWNLKKIGLENAYQYIKKSTYGSEFINDHVRDIQKSSEYLFLSKSLPEENVDAERLIPYFVWKKSL